MVEISRKLTDAALGKLYGPDLRIIAFQGCLSRIQGFQLFPERIHLLPSL